MRTSNVEEPPRALPNPTNPDSARPRTRRILGSAPLGPPAPSLQRRPATSRVTGALSYSTTLLLAHSLLLAGGCFGAGDGPSPAPATPSVVTPGPLGPKGPNRPPGPPRTWPIARLDLASLRAECALEPRVPAEGYRGLLTDVHVHSTPHDAPDAFALRLLQEMNEAGVDRVVVQPNHGLGQGPKSLWNLDEAWGAIGAACPRILPLAYAFDPDSPDGVAYVEAALRSRRFAGVGEVEFQHTKMDLRHDPESVPMMAIYRLLEPGPTPLHFQGDPSRDPKLADAVRRVVGAHPRVPFVWFGNTEPHKFIDLPNLYFNVFVHMDAWRPPDEVVARSMLGSDAAPAGFWNPGSPALPYASFGEAMVKARLALGKLPPELADALAHGNFDAVWPKAPKVPGG